MASSADKPIYTERVLSSGVPRRGAAGRRSVGRPQVAKGCAKQEAAGLRGIEIAGHHRAALQQRIAEDLLGIRFAKRHVLMARSSSGDSMIEDARLD
jgi:hypothetical protein